MKTRYIIPDKTKDVLECIRTDEYVMDEVFNVWKKNCVNADLVLRAIEHRLKSKYKGDKDEKDIF